MSDLFSKDMIKLGALALVFKLLFWGGVVALVVWGVKEIAG